MHIYSSLTTGLLLPGDISNSNPTTHPQIEFLPTTHSYRVALPMSPWHSMDTPNIDRVRIGGNFGCGTIPRSPDKYGLVTKSLATVAQPTSCQHHPAPHGEWTTPTRSRVLAPLETDLYARDVSRRTGLQQQSGWWVFSSPVSPPLQMCGGPWTSAQTHVPGYPPLLQK